MKFSVLPDTFHAAFLPRQTVWKETKNVDCVCFSPTFHTDDVWSHSGPQLVLSRTVIMSRVGGLDGAEDQLRSALQLPEVEIALVPGVSGCNVSNAVAATGQSHCTALYDLTRGADRHRGKVWSVWRERHEQICGLKMRILREKGTLSL